MADGSGGHGRGSSRRLGYVIGAVVLLLLLGWLLGLFGGAEVETDEADLTEEPAEAGEETGDD